MRCPPVSFKTLFIQQLISDHLPSWIVALIALINAIVFSGNAFAHEIRPAVATVSIESSERYNVELKLNAEALLAGVSPEHQDTDDSPEADAYNRLRSLGAAHLTAEIFQSEQSISKGLGIRFDNHVKPPKLANVEVPETGDIRRARISKLTFTGEIPAGTDTFTWSYSRNFGNSVLKIQRKDNEEYAALLDVGETSKPYSLTGVTPKPSSWQTVLRYVSLGFTHIIPKGLDHILFVLGLFLLSQQFVPLLWQVTAFTLAHSITLGLTIYGVFSLSSTIVEPLIALSIVYVAVENILTRQLKPWRILIVFLFGLLHGMGFAGVLSEIGLPSGDFLIALIGFNAGVELGQLAVIAGAFLLVGVCGRGKSWYRSRVTIPLSLVIGLIGLYWTWERISGQLTL